MSAEPDNSPVVTRPPRSEPPAEAHRQGFAGKGAIITGGTSGIGLAVAEALAGQGAAVVVTGRDATRGRAAERQLGQVGHAWFVAADATDAVAVGRSVEAARDRLGHIDALVNSAGIALVAPLIDTPVDAFDRLMAANVRAPLLYAQAARPHLAERRGSVVNIGSDAGLRGEQAIGAYSVSKAAVVMMTKMLALDLAPDVRCNCVCPGATAPGMRHIGPPDAPETGDDPSQWSIPPLGRVGQGSDIAEAVLFFLSERSSFCSGATLLVDGGLQAGVAAVTKPPG